MILIGCFKGVISPMRLLHLNLSLQVQHWKIFRRFQFQNFVQLEFLQHSH